MNKIPVSNGEICDKASILLIKSTEIKNHLHLSHVEFELSQLNPLLRSFESINGFSQVFESLIKTNKEIWDLMEYTYQNFEKNDSEYMEVMNQTVILNKRRSYLKKEIDVITGSQITEAKSYF